MARLLVTSLLRTGWHGRIVVFRNHARPVLPEGHPSVTEVVLSDTPEPAWHRIVSWKFRVREQLDLNGIGKVLFVDCDCLALRSINHLMFGSWDIFTAPEPGRIVEFPFNGYLRDDEMTLLQNEPGLNCGTIGIRAEHFQTVMEHWESLHAVEPPSPTKFRDQHSWNRLVLDTCLRHRNFAPGEIQFPFLHRAIYPDYRRAALVHAASGEHSPTEKLSLLYGLWAEVFGYENFEAFTAPRGVAGQA
jgi:hypothetical protein